MNPRTRQKRIDSGLCAGCGKVPPVAGMRQCQSCRDATRAARPAKKPLAEAERLARNEAEKLRRQTPEYKAWYKEWRAAYKARPEVKERLREKESQPKRKAAQNAARRNRRAAPDAREKYNESQRDYRKAKPELVRGLDRARYQRDPEKRKALCTRVRQANREVYSHRQAEVRRALKLAVLTHYGNGKPACIICGEGRMGALSIDHVGGGGRQHLRDISRTEKASRALYRWLKANNYPEGFRTLCMNCNWLDGVERRLAARKDPDAKLVIKRRYQARTKRRFMDRLGGKCCVCGFSNIDALTAHHVNNDGAAHREEICNGGGGVNFYARILELDDFTGLECRCLSCNCEESWRVRDGEAD